MGCVWLRVWRLILILEITVGFSNYIWRPEENLVGA